VNGREKSSIGDKDARRTQLGLAACARLGNKGLTLPGRVKSLVGWQSEIRNKQSNDALKLLQAEHEAKERTTVRVYRISSVVGTLIPKVFPINQCIMCIMLSFFGCE
jgi:hypothetical protein